MIYQLLRSGRPSVALVANRLGTSPRSLQRHLSEVNLTYSELVDSVRCEAAQTLLGATDLQIQEIAILLGYGIPSNFARAFTRWTGFTPRAYRKANSSCANERKNVLARNGQNFRHESRIVRHTGIREVRDRPARKSRDDPS